jgi:hypothetical protein
MHHRLKPMSASNPIPRWLLTASIAAVLAGGASAQSAAADKAAEPAAAASPAASDAGKSRRERRAEANAKRKDSEPAKAPAQAAAAQKAPAQATGDEDKLICRTQKITGSNFSKRTCATAAQWAAAEEHAQESLKKIQAQPITGVQEGIQ